MRVARVEREAQVNCVLLLELVLRMVWSGFLLYAFDGHFYNQTRRLKLMAVMFIPTLSALVSQLPSSPS